MFDLVWGYGTKFVNFMQRHGLLPDPVRKFLRNIAHVIILDPPERTILTTDGRRYITPKHHKGSRSYKNGTYEQELVKYLQENIKSDDIFVDVGAFIGFYSVLFSKKLNNNGQIFSIEPEQNAFKYLNLNVKLNNIKNITLINKAASSEDGSIKFRKSVSSGIGTAGGFVVNDEEIETTSIESIKIDSLGLKNIDWIKIDIDGHETSCLQGLSETIHNSPNLKLIIEIDPSHFNKSHDGNSLLDILKLYGFTHGIICEEGGALRDMASMSQIKGHRNVIFFKNENSECY